MQAFSFEAITPVELQLFTATTKDDQVDLEWTTSTETNNSGFEVEREVSSKPSSAGNNWERIGFVKGNGTTTQRHYYSYNDKNLEPGNYNYRLNQIDYDGSSHYSKIAYAEVIGLNQFELYQNYPNPFNPTTTISYYLPKNANIKLNVYNVLGQKVAELINGYQTEGKHHIEFDAGKLSSGVYFYKLQTGDYISIKKMAVAK